MSDIELNATEDHIALVTINRPERRNALRPNTLAEMHRTCPASSAHPDRRSCC